MVMIVLLVIESTSFSNVHVVSLNMSKIANWSLVTITKQTVKGKRLIKVPTGWTD